MDNGVSPKIKVGYLRWTNIFISVLFFTWLSSFAYADIRVGTVKFDPPYVLSLDQGFEIQLIKLICQRMNQQCTLIQMPYYQLFEELLKGSIDIGIDSIPFYLSSPDGDPYIYSYPYLLSKGQFVVLRSSKINAIKDIPQGSTVGLVKESGEPGRGLFYRFFVAKYGNTFQVKLFDDIESLISDLSSGNITAVFLDNNEANYWELNGGDQFDALETPMKVADGIGIVALPHNQALINSINQQLISIESGSAYINLYNTYFHMGN
ncbi:TPA: transporter substrate-binding domain-containing protein [Legionella feeleii]|uniref:Arginine-binding periplasmic protein n=1 Tax=Legionella feeleii TaxID=453 RepID=A0A0W0U5X3_9GAMM|nr:transporter substrate-binding domain-containing protein [Legionella feeleii]KTD03142.1 arginine-binding periplasmic protein [Legionella feeleii]SPX61370.1 arginine-binding periplasmic protein [Legionella feeleii]